MVQVETCRAPCVHIDDQQPSRSSRRPCSATRLSLTSDRRRRTAQYQRGADGSPRRVRGCVERRDEFDRVESIPRQGSASIAGGDCRALRPSPRRGVCCQRVQRGAPDRPTHVRWTRPNRSDLRTDLRNARANLEDDGNDRRRGQPSRRLLARPRRGSPRRERTQPARCLFVQPKQPHRRRGSA